MELMRCRNCGFTTQYINPQLQINCGIDQLTICDFEIVEVQGDIQVVVKRFGKPGTELRHLLKELGITDKLGCGCAKFAKTMDVWGVHGCKINKHVAIEKLEEASKKTSWKEKLTVATHGYLTVESLINEAIKRAEAKEVIVAENTTQDIPPTVSQNPETPQQGTSDTPGKINTA